MKLPNPLFIFLNIIVIGVVIFSFSELRQVEAPPTRPYVRVTPYMLPPSPTPRPKQVDVKKDNVTADTSAAPGTYLLDVICPAGYGVRNIKCTNNDSGRDDVFLIGFSKNAHRPNQYGGYCQYKTTKTFSGGISATCDEDFSNIPAFNAADFSPGLYAEIPPRIELWQHQTSVKSGTAEKLSLTCPVGYAASDISCDIDMESVGMITSALKINTAKGEAGETGECLYQAGSSLNGSIRMYCVKQ